MPTDLRLCDVTFSSGGVMLAGSIAMPRAGTPSAGVVMVGGSGPSDRNNGTYFPPIRQHFVEAGLTVLCYDKRGVGESAGDWRDATMDDLAADAAAALRFLRTQPGMRASPAGLYGHSEGGWVVLRAAATLTLYDRLIEAGRSDGSFAEAARLVDAASKPSLFTDYWADVDGPLWEFLKRKQDHDPIPDALRLRCPHLAAFGGADELVPVADSVRLFSSAAGQPRRSRRAALTVMVFPGADHRIQVDAGTRMAPGYLPTLTHWINAWAGIESGA